MEPTKAVIKNQNNCNHQNRQARRLSALQCKQFKERKSIFTEFSETKHFITIKHLFYSLLFGLLLKDFTFSFVLNKKVDYGLRLITYGFGKFYLILLLWSIMFIVNLLTFYMFNLWVHVRVKLPPSAVSVIVWLDRTFLCLLIAYYISVFYTMPVLTRSFDLPVLSAFSLTVEQVRMLMKFHSFVRTNAVDVLAYKAHSETELFRPSLTHYIYFLFAPTLVYRHEYPRTRSINWALVVQCILEVAACLWLNSYIANYFFITKFENIGIDNHSWSYVIVVILEAVIAGFVIKILLFNLLLHSWLNGFAEFLRFGDRKFYDDWWTSTNFQIYFRKWNIVVQDWLYEYVYKDFCEILTPNSKVVPKVMVFLISAVVHEYIISVAMRQFFPFLFINFFVFGMIFSFLTTKHIIYNILFLYSLSLGFSLNISLYTMEGFARLNCPVVEYNTTISYFIPTIFSAQCINGF